MKTLALLITVHNRKDRTLMCLKEVMRQVLPNDFKLDVYLTDDGCTDGTAEAVKENFPDVTIIKGNGNLFWNRGMYKAWEKASETKDYDFYFWLNDDTILKEDAILAMVNETYSKPKSVIVGSCHSSKEHNKITYGGHFCGRKIYPNGYLQKCQTFNGNVVLIPKYVFKKIGNLDWRYEHAIGDIDYGWMVTHSGLSNYVSRDFRGICDNNANPPKWINPNVPFRQRWANYHSPLGYGQPGPLFHFNIKNFGLNKALSIWSSNHIRVFFPWLWKRK